MTSWHSKEKISTEEEEWLDNTANLVDKEAIIDLLETASDYEHGLSPSKVMLLT